MEWVVTVESVVSLTFQVKVQVTSLRIKLLEACASAVKLVPQFKNVLSEMIL